MSSERKTTLKERKLVDIPLSALEPNKGQIPGVPANPRQITEAKLSKLTANIKEYPEMLEYRSLMVYPLGDRYVIIGGNMRYVALKKLGYESAPCVVIPEETTADRLKAYTILDNNGFGQWDWDMLANEWDADMLSDWGMDLEAFNGEPEDEVEEGEASEDDFDPEKDKVETRVHEGDIWLLGRHKLICGSSTDPAVLQRLFGDKQADLYLTDPPYNVAYEGGTEDKLTIMNDNMGDSEFLKFLTDAFTCASSVLKKGGAFYIWHADSEGLNFRAAAKAADLLWKQTLIWNKNTLVMGRQDYQWKHEPCAYGWKNGGSHLWFADRKQTTVIDFDKPMKNDIHPTMKPVGLFGYQMKNSSREGDLVFDGFLGSGTSLVAAEQLGRVCYGCELDPKYCDAIIARWEKLTGGTARKAN